MRPHTVALSRMRQRIWLSLAEIRCLHDAAWTVPVVRHGQQWLVVATPGLGLYDGGAFVEVELYL